MKCAEDIMRPATATISVEQTLREALACLNHQDCNELIVLDDGEAVGLLDDTIMQEIDTDTATVGDEMVGNVMESRIGNCRPDDSSEDILSLVERYRLRCIFVVDNRRQLRGWIAPKDLS